MEMAVGLRMQNFEDNTFELVLLELSSQGNDLL